MTQVVKILNKFWLVLNDKLIRVAKNNSDSSLSANRDMPPLNDIDEIKEQRIKNVNNAIFGHLNINSFWNKFIFAKKTI